MNRGRREGRGKMRAKRGINGTIRKHIYMGSRHGPAMIAAAAAGMVHTLGHVHFRIDGSAGTPASDRAAAERKLREGARRVTDRSERRCSPKNEGQRNQRELSNAHALCYAVCPMNFQVRPAVARRISARPGAEGGSSARRCASPRGNCAALPGGAKPGPRATNPVRPKSARRICRRDKRVPCGPVATRPGARAR